METQIELPLILARLRVLTDSTKSSETKELAECMAGICFAVLDVEGDVEKIAERHSYEDNPK